MIIIRRVKDDGGCWGNMAPFPIEYEGSWRTSEALFQALRFEDEKVREEIRSEKSPMGAKQKAKSNLSKMSVKPMSEKDIQNMRLVLTLKLEQHPELKKKLLETGDQLIIEDCTKRQHGSGLFWGAALVDGKWVGENWLGKIWMSLRESIRVESCSNTKE